MLKKRISLTVTLLLLIVGGFFAMTTSAFATPDLVNDPDTMGGSNNGEDVYAEIATIRLGNNLDTKVSYAKFSYPTPNNNTFRIGYCKQGERGCDGSARNNVYIEVCNINAQETGVVASSCRTIVKPAAGVPLPLPSGAPESLRNKGRHTYRVKVGFINHNTSPRPVYAFRLRALGGRAGFFNHASFGENLPIAIQNRNVSRSALKDNLTIRFRIPCETTLPANYTIKWKDADATPGSQPYNPDIGWTMVLKNQAGAFKKSLTSVNFAGAAVGTTTHQNYMRGQDQDKEQSVGRGSGSLQFNYEAGDIVEWTWNNVLGTNGVQFQVPFDDANVDQGCTVADQYKGTCSVSTPDRVAIGETFSADFTATNTGTAAWSVVPSGGIGLGSSNPLDNNKWGRTRSYIKGGEVEETGFGPILYSNKTARWTEENVYTTTGLTPGFHTFSWRIYKPSPSPIVSIAECSTTIQIYDKTNYPFVRATTNDVMAGALFSPSGSQPCTYRAQEFNIAANAKVKTYNMGSLSDYDRAVVFTGRLFYAILGRTASAADGNYWINQVYREYSSDERAIEVLLNSAITGERSSPSVGYLFNQTTKTLSSSNYGAFVDRLYENAFGRSADTDGRSYWVGQLTSGSYTPVELIHYFVRSSDTTGAPFSLNDGGANSYGGSGSEYGVFSTGTNVFDFGLKGFTGANGRVRPSPGRFDLVFSNNATATIQDDEEAEGEYGSFSNTPFCLQNYYEKYENMHTQANVPANSIAGGTASTNGTAARNRVQALPAGAPTAVVKVTAPITLPATSISGNKRVVLLVDGDITINGNITYSGYGTGAAPTVPEFILVARNITINPGVSQLDGVYIAQPRITTGAQAQYNDTSGVSGIIQTCSAKQTTPNGTCATSQLKVNGSLFARRFRLYRTWGSLGASFAGTSDSMADLRCGLLSDYQRNSSPKKEGFLFEREFLYDSTSGKSNTCAAERVDSSGERYLPTLLNASPNASAQSFQELPPIY